MRCRLALVLQVVLALHDWGKTHVHPASLRSVPAQKDVPHILHHVYLAGLDELGAKPLAVERRSSCIAQHPGWEHRLWTAAEAEALVEQDFPWFAQIWANYDRWVRSSLSAPSALCSLCSLDLERRKVSAQPCLPPRRCSGRCNSIHATLQVWRRGAHLLCRVVLHHHQAAKTQPTVGAKAQYLDFDVECLAPMETSIARGSIILQGSGQEGITNAVLASAPGQPFWLGVLQNCEERAGVIRWNTDIAVVLTGPDVIGEAFRRRCLVHTKESYPGTFGFLGGSYQVHALTLSWSPVCQGSSAMSAARCPESRGIVHVWPFGTWMSPCWHTNAMCC